MVNENTQINLPKRIAENKNESNLMHLLGNMILKMKTENF